MPKPTGPSNVVLKNLIADLKSTGYRDKSDFLLNLARLLETPERRRATVNLSKIEREADGKETIFVPGKVLSSGELKKPLKIASFSISAEAAKKIKAAGGKHIDIPEMLKEHPKGKGVRIIL